MHNENNSGVLILILQLNTLLGVVFYILGVTLLNYDHSYRKTRRNTQMQIRGYECIFLHTKISLKATQRYTQ